MGSTPIRLFFSSSQADDQIPIGSSSRFGFTSMVRLNLALSLARRGIAVGVRTPESEASISSADIDYVAEKDDGQRAGAGPFGALLRKHRLAAGLSQDALAERARISVNGLSALERGARRTPQRETLGLLVQALGLTSEQRAEFEAAAKRVPRPLAESQTGDELTEDAANADVLIIVLTRAWLADPACPDHVTRFGFGSRSRGEGKGIFVIRRDPFHPDRPIGGLTGDHSFDFFHGIAHARPSEPFYRHDGTTTAAFYDVVDALAEKIFRVGSLDLPVSRNDARSGRTTVYVARPASDMEGAYRTLVAEFESAGYAVVPGPGTSANDDAGFSTIDNDLAAAAASIHLLGDADTVDDDGRSRVGFPLERAAARARAGDAFRRIIFAPKRLATHHGALQRDPIAVRDRFAQALPQDSIVGDGVTDFVLAARDLIRSAGRMQTQPESAPLAAGSAVFLNFHPSDAQYARAVSKALRERGLRARFAAFEDDKVQNKITNVALVRESDAVVHCWASASDAWLYAEASDYEDWRKFGRSQPFRTRAAIAGPPERGSKMLYSSDDPPEAIDVYLDLTSRPLPLASDLDPIVANVEFPRPQ